MTSIVRLTSKDALRDWLKDKPHPWAQAIAIRAALRALPVIGRIIDSKFKDNRAPSRGIVAVARANFVTTVVLVQKANHTAAFATAAADDAAFATAAVGAAAYGIAAYYAATTAYAPNAAAYAAAAAAAAYDETDASIWQSLSHDATWLEATEDAPAPDRGVLLLRQPLWQGSAPEPLRTAWSQFANSSFAVEHGFQPWIQWYEALASLEDGRSPRPVFSDALALRIATQPDEWWKRPAKEVNADIANWLREETASGNRSDPQHDLVQALDALPLQQPAPYQFDWRDGRMEVLPPDALPEDGGIAQDYLNETREKADDLLEALARSNTDPTIARKVGRLREVLTDRTADLRPALVDSRSISVERHVKALDNPQDAAEIPTRILADLGDLADTARRLCNCLPALWQRDVERLANSLSPDSASALLHHLDALRDGIKDADIIGPDVQAAFDTLSEDSAEPDAEDVRHRRIAMFGLTARNLLTTLLRASKGAANELVRFAKDVRKELRPEAVKGTAKAIVGLPIAAAYLTVMLLEPASGIAKVFPEIGRIFERLNALKAGEGKPPAPPPSTEPPLSPRIQRPTAERGPTRPA
ncbi:hypothetical protein ACCD06_17230 [Azospirillum sp. CT11-132]|uniref:hypothetical protein n=1 Tax=Azospirillum sp. CT11-132 TaxID=3396317 RepID=UPI0039A6D3C6